MKTNMKHILLSTILFWIGNCAYAQMPSWYGKKGVQVVTCHADEDGDYTMGVLDTRDRTSAPLSLDWMPTMHHDPSWIRSNLGQVFGIALDGSYNIYVTASSSYGMPNAYNSPNLTGVYGPSGSGAVYKIDGFTGAISTFVVIPQDQTVLVVDDTGPNVQLKDKDGNRVGAGLGNICYDADHNQFFVTSFDDGKIYRISNSGTILNSFDPQSCPDCIPDPSPTNTGDDVISPLGDRPWAVGYYDGKLYFSIWTEDRRSANPPPLSTTFNQVFSVALDGTGNFTGTETLEVTIPGFKKDGASNPNLDSNPISDIEFDLDGNMALAERGMISDVDASGHRSGVFFLERSGAGTYTSPLNYPTSPPYIRIGTAPNNESGSASGGVDFTYDSYDSGNMEADGNLTYIWATGHRLRKTEDDGGPGGSNYTLSGSQMSPVSGWTPNGDFWQYSYFADFDGIPDNPNKTAQGDVDVIRGAAAPSVCAIEVTSATPGACTPATNQYTLTGALTFANAPTTGTLTVSVSGGGSQVFNAPFTSPQNYSIAGLTSDGASHTVTAVFSADPTCTNTVNYTAPASCMVVCVPPAAPVLSVTQNVCPSTTGSFGVSTACGAGSTLYYSTDNGVTWSTTSPAWSNGVSVIGRCLNDSGNTCFSTNSSPVVASLVNCTIPCSLTITAAGPTTAGCDPATNKYVMQVSVTYSGIASGEGIIINGQTVLADGTGTQTFVLPITFDSDGQPEMVTAAVANNPTCTDADGFTFTAPVSCDAPLNPCEAPACNPVPTYQVCSDGSTSQTLSVPAGYTNTIWYNSNGDQVGTGPTLIVDDSLLGADNSECFYSESFDANACPAQSCCPVIIESESCCPFPNCRQIIVSPNN